MRHVIRGGLLVGILLSLVLTVWGSMSVAPLSLQLDVNPGETEPSSFLVRNTGTETIEIGITLHDWWRTETGTLQILPAGQLERSCAEWLVYSETSVLLEPGEERAIELQLSVPEDTTGDHWAMFLVEERPQPDEQEAADEGLEDTTRVVVAYAVKVLHRDPANRQTEALITGVDVSQTDPLQVAVTFENTGTAHMTTVGTVEIRDVTGEAVVSFPVDPFPTLPSEIRTVIVDAPVDHVPLGPGLYYAVVELDFGGEYLIQGGQVFNVGAESQDP